MIFDVSTFISDDGLIQTFFINFKFFSMYLKYLLTEVKDLIVWHIKYDKCIWEDTLTLHRQALNSSPWITWQYETFLFFLDGFDFLLDHLCNNIVFHYGEMLEVGLDFLSQLLFFGHLFFEEVANWNRCKLIIISHLKSKLSYFESRRSNNENLLS